MTWKSDLKLATVLDKEFPIMSIADLPFFQPLNTSTILRSYHDKVISSNDKFAGEMPYCMPSRVNTPQPQQAFIAACHLNAKFLPMLAVHYPACAGQHRLGKAGEHAGSIRLWVHQVATDSLSVLEVGQPAPRAAERLDAQLFCLLFGNSQDEVV